MGKSGSGGRTDWKDKMDQSSWVDSTPLAGSEQDDAADGVEFLEVEPSAFRLNQPTEEVSESLLTSSTSRILALGAVGVVLVALAIMSRPGDQDPFDQLPTADQQQILERQGRLDDEASPDAAAGTDDAADDAAEGEGSASDDAAAGGESESGTGSSSGSESGEVPIPPIPGLRTDLPETLDGTLHLTGSDGSLVSVRWADGEIDELPFPTWDDGGRPEVESMRVAGSELIMFGEQTLLQLTDSELESNSADILGLLPSDSGLTVLVSEPGGERRAFLVPPPDREPPEDVAALWVGHDLNPIGRWNDRLLAEKAGQVWILDQDGTGGTAITDGQLLSFDGRQLAMLRCGGQLECRIEIGPPDQPSRVVLPIPELLAGRPPTGWGPSITVSEDGRRMALVDDTGAFSAPLSIDLDTGEVTEGTDIVNGDSPLAWSPDGQVLAYAFGDDLVLWDRETDERYRIDIDREIDLMVWAPDPAVES